MARRVLLVVSAVAVVAAVVLLRGVSGGSVAAVRAGGVQASGGVLDPIFGKGGKVLTGFLGDDSAAGVAVQADGKIVAAGTATSIGHVSDVDGDFALARYTARGTLDAGFGRGGKVVTDLAIPRGRSNESANAVVIQADGKILVAGGCDSFGFALVRYTTGGRLDASFGSDGKVVTGRSYDEAFALAVQSDGKILVAGEGQLGLVRYTASGKLDASFGRGGKVLTDLDAGAKAVVVQKDGKIVVGGSTGSYGERSEFALFRYMTSGMLDASFGTRGKVLTNFGAKRHDTVSAVAIEDDGKIVVAGSSYSLGKGGSDFALVRYTTDGKLDSRFGRGGKVLTDLGSSDVASAVALQADGKIVAAGHTGAYKGDFALVRYTSGGKPDASFGSRGKVVTDLGGSEAQDSARAVAIQKDGKIIAAGGRSDSTNGFGRAYFALARYTK